MGKLTGDGKGGIGQKLTELRDMHDLAPTGGGEFQRRVLRNYDKHALKSDDARRNEALSADFPDISTFRVVPI